MTTPGPICARACSRRGAAAGWAQYAPGPDGFKAYLGVQHCDPGHWGRPGDAYCRFFLSLWAGGRLREMRTHETMRQALDRLWGFYQQAVGAVPPREGFRAAPGV